MARLAPVQARPLLPPRLSLVLAAEALQAGDDRWEGGFAWQPEGCGGAGRFDLCGPGGLVRDIPASAGQLEFVPFGVWAGEICSTFGWEEREWEARARRLLEACESSQIEAEFWRGDIARAGGHPNRYLAEAGTPTIAGAAQEPMDALATLEDAIADCVCNGRGWIHATRGVVSVWSRTGALRREGNLLLTAMDTIVIPGTGYDGSGPANTGDTPANLAVTAQAGAGLPDGTYGYKVTAHFGDDRESVPTAEDTVVLGGGNNVARVDWDPVGDADGYFVYGRDDGGPWMQLAFTGVGVTVFDDDGTNVPSPIIAAPEAGIAAPETALEGSVWAYASGPVDVRRGPIETLPRSLREARELVGGVDREVNDIKMWAQRSAAATWDACCHIAVRIDAPLYSFA